MLKRISMLSLVILFIFSGYSWATVNRSIRISSGEKVDRSLSSVNGSVVVGDDCIIHGSCHSVNGRVEIGSGSETEGANTVNGSITLGDGVRILGNVKTVNGGIRCGEKVRVEGRLSTVNGSITSLSGSTFFHDLKTVNGKFELRGTSVEGEMSTVNGNILLADNTVVKGSIWIKRKRHGFSLFWRSFRPLTIRISSGSRIEGDIIVEGERTKVTVVIEKGAVVKGKIKGDAKVIRN